MNKFLQAVNQILQQKHSPTSVSLSYTPDVLDDTPLCIGDYISLYVESNSAHGFVNVDGIVNYQCGLKLLPKNQYPNRFRECVFMIHNANQYKAQKNFYKKLEQYGLKEFDSKNLDDYPELNSEAKEILSNLQEKMEEERRKNETEHENALGRKIQFGQTIQLLHVRSKKFLSVARESAELQRDCLMTVLDEHGSSACYFTFLPFFKFKIEGEQVLLLGWIFKY